VTTSPARPSERYQVKRWPGKPTVVNRTRTAAPGGREHDRSCPLPACLPRSTPRTLYWGCPRCVLAVSRDFRFRCLSASGMRSRELLCPLCT
jgi:hypothetical protein